MRESLGAFLAAGYHEPFWATFGIKSDPVEHFPCPLPDLTSANLVYVVELEQVKVCEVEREWLVQI